VKKTTVLLTLSIAALLIACTSAKSGGVRVQVTGDHLRAMVLTRDDLGPEYADYGMDPASGPRTSEQLVEEADNPDDEALDVAKFAILLGHEDTYLSLGNLQSRSGVLLLTDGIVLYANKAATEGDFSDTVGDMKRDFSGTTRFGSLQAFQTFKPKIGEAARGQIIRLMTSGNNFGINSVVNITITSIQFRRDQMVGSVVLMRFDAKDVKGEVTDLARKLDKRMQAVLRGESPDGAPAAPGVLAPEQQPSQ
jgi:hypothetical protein